MAYKIVVDIVDPQDQKIHVTHTFWGKTEKEARGHFAGHLAECDYFADAEEDERLIEEVFEIPDEELPEVETIDIESETVEGEEEEEEET